MEKTSQISNITRRNWIMDAGLFLSAVIASLSGIYFLYLPDGGYMGGRNPYYGIRILFERETWEWLHTWIGLAMVLVAVIHLILHGAWVVSTTRRVIQSVFQPKGKWNRASLRNVWINGVLGLSFVICSLSGIYFLFSPDSKGGLVADPMFLLSRTGWDMLHTWSGVTMIGAALMHLLLHWGWVTKVTRKIFKKQVFALAQPAGQ